MQKRFPQSHELRRSILLGIAIGLGIGIVFAAGFFFRDALARVSPAFASPAELSEDYNLLAEVQGLLNRHYLREQPDLMQRQYAAVRGMLASLGDPYTFFIDPPVAASESDTLAGTYGGIGVQLQRNAEGMLVMYPYEGSPAEAAGIENDDILLAVNGAQVDASQSLDAIDQMLRGEVREGSGAEVTFRKAGTEVENTVFIAFDVINVPSVMWRLVEDAPEVGYVQVIRFTARTPDEVRTAIAELTTAGAESLVLDLRNNSGGLLQESIQVADEFLGSGVVVYERDNQSEQAFEAEAGGAWADGELVVLINDRTASGAELVAGALQDNDRAELIGQPSFGKGTVQQIFPLSDSSSLHVTSSEWLTPDRQALNENGLQPDVPVPTDPNGRDLSLETAVQYLLQERVDDDA